MADDFKPGDFVICWRFTDSPVCRVSHNTYWISSELDDVDEIYVLIPPQTVPGVNNSFTITLELLRNNYIHVPNPLPLTMDRVAEMYNTCLRTNSK